MGFNDSYKHLEKLCGEVLNDDRRISAYIDEMLNTPSGSYYVKNWDEDLKKLKHYRWVRNQISHEPDCNEFNMCEPGDELWLDNFYSRIMNQTDPLTLYYEATTSRQNTEPIQPLTQKTPIQAQPHNNYRKSSRTPVGCAIFIFALAIAAAIILIWNNI